MEKKEFREQVLKLQNEVIKTGFKWEDIFRAQVLNEDRTEWVIMIGDKLASKELLQKMYQKKQTEEHLVKTNGKPESLHGENEYLSRGGVDLLYYKKTQSTHVALYIK